MPKTRKLSKHGDKMLAELGTQLVEIAAKYIQFKQLFLSGEDRKAILHRTAPSFFEYIGESLMRDIILSLARLCDPAKTGKNENLTFERLADELEEPYKKRYLKRVAALSKRIKRVRIWRHKHLAHNDLTHALRKKKLPTVKYEYITACVKDAVKLLNIAVCSYKGEVYMHYDQVMIEGGADRLVNHLRMRFDYVDEQQAILDESKA